MAGSVNSQCRTVDILTYLVEDAASIFNQLGQYANSPGHRA